MIAVFALISAAFVIWRAVWTVPTRRIWFKILLALTILAAAFKFQLFHLFGGPMYFAPVLPRWLLITGALIFAVHFIFFWLLLIAEALRLLCRLTAAFLRRKLPENLKRAGHWINLLLFICAVIFSGIGLWQGAALPEVREVKFRIAGLPDAADKLKIVFITDLHIDHMSDPERLPQIVGRINSLNPDLILLGGDMMDGKTDVLGNAVLPLKNLRAKYGVYGVPGNHEYYSGFDQWMNFLTAECKVNMLVNRSCRPGCGITLVGVGDYAGKRMNKPAVNFRQAFKDVDVKEKVILLAHRPDLAREAEKLDVMLQISGHTHGGMVWGLDKIVGMLNGGFVSGSYQRGGTSVYVSNGAGIWGGFPVRLSALSEISLIILEKI